MTQVCYTCKIEKPLDDFYNNRIRESGKHGQCKICHKAAQKPKTKEKSRRDAKAYYERHPERVKERFKKWYYENRDELLERKRDSDKHPRRKQLQREWNNANRDRLNALRRERKKNMPIKQKLEKKIRDRFYKVVVRMKSGKKHTSILNLIGCSIDELKIYIESKFAEGMTWDNHGNGEGKWNIDHIIPLVQFDLFDLEEQKKAFHYTNLRPLWFVDNMSRPRKYYKHDALT